MRMRTYLSLLLCVVCMMWGCALESESAGGSGPSYEEIIDIATKIAERENLLPASYTTAVRKDAADGSWVVIFLQKALCV